MIVGIKFQDFNERRKMRGADAASFQIIYSDDVSDYVWMSKRDIVKNITLFPQFCEELNKGLKAYAGVKS